MKLEKLNKSYKVITDNGKNIGSFQLDCDGSYYFWESNDLTGCWDARNLKEIAELLDEVNKPFDDNVKEYFAKEKEEFEIAAEKEYKGLLKTGMFFEWYAHLSGDWDKDKETWLLDYAELLDMRSGKIGF